MFTPTAGVPAAPPALGLVAAAARPTLDRWEQGLAWVPERCGTSYQLVPLCADPTDYEAPRPGAAYYQPVGVRLADECTTLGGPLDEERVRRIAEAQTPFAVARELWTGEGSAGEPYLIPGDNQPRINAALATDAADTIGTGPASARVAIGRLEQAAVEAAHGQQVYLHVPIAVLPQLDGYLTRRGQVLYTLADNVVVADAGYPGTGPEGETAGATVWAYATAPVQVLISPLSAIAIDRDTVTARTNTRTAWAERLIAATFDPCLHFATEIELEPS